MSRTRWSLLVVSFCLIPPLAYAEDPGVAAAADWKLGTDWCQREIESNVPGVDKVVDKTLIVIDHRDNRVVCPAAPLKVREGKFVRAIFLRTHPNSFSYELSAIEAPTPRSVAATTGKEKVPVPESELTSTSLALRHDRHVSQYTITIKAVDDQPVPVADEEGDDDAAVAATESEVEATLRSRVPELSTKEREAAAEEITTRAYRIGPSARDLKEMVQEELAQIEVDEDKIEPVAQDLAGSLTQEVEPLVYLRPFKITVEVETAGPELTFTSGFSYSDITDPRYFVAANDHETDPTGDDTTDVHEDHSGDDVEPDVMALINMRWPDLKNRVLNKLGVAFGLGLNGDNEPRYFLGPSFTLPKGFVFTAGLAGGEIKVLPAGQGLGKPLVTGTTLPALEGDFKVGFHVGISFAFTDREKEIATHLSGLKAISEPATPAQPSGGGGGGDDEEEEDEGGD